MLGLKQARHGHRPNEGLMHSGGWRVNQTRAERVLHEKGDLIRLHRIVGLKLTGIDAIHES
jgi:hypothetical protein